VLMVQMAKWIIGDFDTSFGAMLKMFQDAVIIE